MRIGCHLRWGGQHPRGRGRIKRHFPGKFSDYIIKRHITCYLLNSQIKLSFRLSKILLKDNRISCSRQRDKKQTDKNFYNEFDSFLALDRYKRLDFLFLKPHSHRLSICSEIEKLLIKVEKKGISNGRINIHCS